MSLKSLGLKYMMKEIIEGYMKRKEIIYGNKALIFGMSKVKKRIEVIQCKRWYIR